MKYDMKFQVYAMQLNPNIKCITGHCKLKHTVSTVHIWICALLLMTLPETRRSKDKNNQTWNKQKGLARFRIRLTVTWILSVSILTLGRI